MPCLSTIIKPGQNFHFILGNPKFTFFCFFSVKWKTMTGEGSSDKISLVLVIDPDNGQPVEIETDFDGTLPLKTLQRNFPGANGLKFRNPVSGNWRSVSDDDGQRLCPPSGGWNGIEFSIIGPPSRPSSSMGGFTEEQRNTLLELCNERLRPASRSPSPITFENIGGQCAKEYIDRFEAFLGYVKCHEDGPRFLKGCVTIVKDDYAVTNSHIAVSEYFYEYRRKITERIAKREDPKQKNAAGYGKGQKRPRKESDVAVDTVEDWAAKREYDLRGREIKVYTCKSDKCVRTKIVKVDFHHDLVILKSKEGGGLLNDEVEPLEFGDDCVGTNYVALGLPLKNGHQNTSLFKGHISATKKCHYRGYILGAYGAERGFSGGPVISLGSVNRLVGIVVGAPRIDVAYGSSLEELRVALSDPSTQASLVHIIPQHFFSTLIAPDELEATCSQDDCLF